MASAKHRMEEERREIDEFRSRQTSPPQSPPKVLADAYREFFRLFGRQCPIKQAHLADHQKGICDKHSKVFLARIFDF